VGRGYLGREVSDMLPFLPMTAEEAGHRPLDVILVTGDAYVDHPAWGVAAIGRWLEAHGFSVGIIAQPDWRNPDAFAALGRPRLFFGVTAGNMDTQVNRFTASRRLRSSDAYSPGGQVGLRPDRATIPYVSRVKQAFPGVPVVVGGVEASLRRFVHYDFWQDKIRGSILLEAKADLLVSLRARPSRPAAICPARPGPRAARTPSPKAPTSSRCPTWPPAGPIRTPSTAPPC
jgi:uncharacterized radical SAM protein YgiQ